MSSWDKTFFLTAPWNWIRPQMLQAQTQDSVKIAPLAPLTLLTLLTLLTRQC